MLGRTVRQSSPVLLALSLLLFSQASEAQGRAGARGPWPDRPTLVRAGVRVLDARTLETLAYGSQGTSVLVFEPATPRLHRLSRGDVLVAGVAASTPHGLLRRVTRVDRREGVLVVETEHAAIEDVFWSARLRDRIEMRPGDIALATPEAEGVLVPDAAQAWSPGPIEFDLLEVVLLDLDGDPTTTGDQIKATGTVAVEPTFDLDIDISWGRLRRFEFTNTTQLRAALELDARVTAADFNHTVTVASVRFAPVTIAVGPIPLVFTPTLDIQVGASGSVTAGLRTSVTATAPVAAGLILENNEWRGFADLPDGPEDVEIEWRAPELTAAAGVEVHAGPQLTLLLYDVGGPYASVHAYSALWAEVLPSRAWSLDVGLRANLGLAVRVPPTGELVRYGLQVFDRRWRAADGSF